MDNRASDSVAGRQLTKKAANGDIALLLQSPRILLANRGWVEGSFES